jgi:hypothetical protein
MWLESQDQLDKQPEYRPNYKYLQSLLWTPPPDRIYNELYTNLVPAYLQRKLTYEEDNLNAFQGILNVLARHLPGGFNWGIPVMYFHAGICWGCQDPGSRITAFPSWSWAGWSYGDAINDHVWLKTTKGVVSILTIWGEPNSEPLATYSSPDIAEMNNELMCHWHPSDVDKAREVGRVWDSLGAERTLSKRFLVFYTSSAHFCLKPSDDRNEVPRNPRRPAKYDIVIPGNDTKASWIYLRPDWVKTHIEPFELIIISHTAGAALIAMLIEMKDGVAYRVTLPWHQFTEEDWLKAKPRRKLIVLG